MTMKMMRNAGVLVVLLSMLILFTGCLEATMIPGVPEYRESDEMIFTAKDQFYLDNFGGKVRVLPSFDGQVRVQYTKVVLGKDEEYLTEVANKLTVKSQEEFEYVKVTTSKPISYPKNIYSMWIEFLIYVPVDTEVQIKTRNSSVEIQGMRENAKVETTNGEIRVEDLFGDVEADTTNGQIVIRDIEGNMDLDATNGQIRIESVEGQVKADSSNGRILVDQDSVIYGAELDTSNGMIQFKGQMVHGYNYDMDTSNARIEVWVDTRLGYDLEAKTSNGSIRFTFPYTFEGTNKKSYFDGRLFSGGIDINLKTSNGNIIFYEQGE